MTGAKAATACINLSALKHNIGKLKEVSPESKTLAVVKANAYGHGLLTVARTLSGVVDGFGVARIGEALKLREEGIEAPVLLLEGFFEAQDLEVISANDLQTVVHSIEQLKDLEAAKLDKPIKVWLKIDTGMHRLGVRPEQLDEFVTRLQACENVENPVCYVSHFGCADDLKSQITPDQIDLFLKLTSSRGGERSLAASAGILAWPDSLLEWNRPGIIMYGVSPFGDKDAKSLGYIPVMTLKSSLIAVREVKKGESVGYGASWTSQRDTKVGVVAIGYGDGYPRTAPNGTPVWINGRKVPVSGRVSMDMLTVDLGPDAQDCVGDEAVLWGEQLPVEEIAKHIGTIGYELVTRLTSRVEMYSVG